MPRRLGRPRETDGKAQTPASFLKLLRKRGAVQTYYGGIWALCETNTHDLVLVNSNDDDAHVFARFTLAPRLVGFVGFRKGEGNVVADAFFKEWEKDALAKLKQVKEPLEEWTALEMIADAHQKAATAFSHQDLIRLLITHSAELPWQTFALVLNDGRKVTATDLDLSPGLLKSHPPLGFIGLLLIAGRLFEFSWPVGKTAKQLQKALEDETEKLRAQRPQSKDLAIHLTADTIALFRGDQ